MTNKKAGLSPAQLGALTGGGVVEVDDGTRRPVQLYCATKNQEVWSKVMTDDDGNEIPVLSFPHDVWDDVLESIGADTDDDKVRIGGMVWMQRKD